MIQRLVEVGRSACASARRNAARPMPVAGVELTLELEDRFVDTMGEGYDAIVRHGPVRDDRIIVKRLSASRRVLVASPRLP